MPVLADDDDPDGGDNVITEDELLGNTGGESDGDTDGSDSSNDGSDGSSDKDETGSSEASDGDGSTDENDGWSDVYI